MAITLEQVRQRRGDIERIARSFGARNVRIFGSVARGESGPESDVDVLVDFEPGRSLLHWVGFECELEELLNCKVDVVVEGGISPYMEERVLAEAVRL